MDQRDQELLDKQLKLVNRSPRNGVLGLGLVFLAGIASGILFAHESKQMQIASHNAAAMAAISNLNGVPPIMR